MPSDHDEQRGLRAARNRAMFRAVNERLRELNEGFAALTESFAITCECADTSCVEMIAIPPWLYEQARTSSRVSIVRPGHVDIDVERVVIADRDWLIVQNREPATEGPEADDQRLRPIRRLRHPVVG